MKTRILMAVFALGLSVEVLAAEKSEAPNISLVGPSSGGRPIDPSELITLVIEGSALSYDTASIPLNDAVDYVNNLLKTKSVAYIGVYAREGTKYGDVVKALDTLRHTSARKIGLSTKELPIGREL